MAIEADGALCGIAQWGAGWDPRCPHINVVVFKEYQRRGIGRSAVLKLLEHTFEDTVAHVVGVEVPSWNEAGLTFAENIGFKKQGAMRRVGIYKGEFFDSVDLDMLRAEYADLKGRWTQ